MVVILVYAIVVLIPLSFNIVSYHGFNFSYNFLLQDKPDKLVFIVFGISLMIVGRWLDFALI